MTDRHPIDWSRCPVGARVEATLAHHTAELESIRTSQVEMARDVRTLLLNGAEQKGVIRGGVTVGKAVWVVLVAAAGAATFLIGWLVG